MTTVVSYQPHEQTIACEAKDTLLRQIDHFITDAALALHGLSAMRDAARRLEELSPRTIVLRGYDLNAPGEEDYTDLGIPSEIHGLIKGSYRQPVRDLIDAIDHTEKVLEAHMRKAEEDHVRVESLC